ncbi:AzlD domain-containing protein [Streptomyces sp. NPDC047980]|uniref:AzlD domain-containing protein n=1 Tax=Streptomyces sp. NPDC047980 TaxID=3365494 RepID=UPI0037167AA5
MTTVWWAILAAAAVSFSYKALGPALLGVRRLPEQAESVIALPAPSLLAGLVVALTGPRWTDLDGTLPAGVAVAAGARLCGAPVLAAVLAGVLATALLRLLLCGRPTTGSGGRRPRRPARRRVGRGPGARRPRHGARRVAAAAPVASACPPPNHPRTRAPGGAPPRRHVPRAMCTARRTVAVAAAHPANG